MTSTTCRVARTSDRAGELSGEVRENPGEAVRKTRNAVGGLRDSPHSTGRVASLGWCFGGGQSLRLSLSDTELDATVMYYPSGVGSVAANGTALRRIDAPILGIFGAEDGAVDVGDARTFDETLGEIGVEREIRIYEGAGHAFANPSGESFRPNATRDAWTRTLRFLDDNLKR